ESLASRGAVDAVTDVDPPRIVDELEGAESEATSGSALLHPAKRVAATSSETANGRRSPARIA
ncbi:MAG: hypothetical protein KA110_09690, partial [Acidimicrobiia bacterium]|nr:hypothetical protein [Acidimicrobiia bacterium]